MDRDEEKEQEGRKSCDTSVGLHCFTVFVNGSRERVKGNEKRLGGLSTFNFWMIFFFHGYINKLHRSSQHKARDNQWNSSRAAAL